MRVTFAGFSAARLTKRYSSNGVFRTNRNRSTTGRRTIAVSSKYAVGGVSLCQPGGRETGESDSHRAGSNLSKVRLAEFENGISKHGRLRGRCRQDPKRDDSWTRRGGLSLRSN